MGSNLYRSDGGEAASNAVSNTSGGTLGDVVATLSNRRRIVFCLGCQMPLCSTPNCDDDGTLVAAKAPQLCSQTFRLRIGANPSRKSHMPTVLGPWNRQSVDEQPRPFRSGGMGLADRGVAAGMEQERISLT